MQESVNEQRPDKIFADAKEVEIKETPPVEEKPSELITEKKEEPIKQSKSVESSDTPSLEQNENFTKIFWRQYDII